MAPLADNAALASAPDRPRTKCLRESCKGADASVGPKRDFSIVL
jgi:hypothetical protein